MSSLPARRLSQAQSHQSRSRSQIRQIPSQPQPQPQPQKLSQPFDIDTYLNPYIPRNPLYLLPTWMSYWFGYRRPLKAGSKPKPLGAHRHRFQTLSTWTSVFIGAFCGVAIIENVFLAMPPLSGHAVPIIIASFGAAAILEYNTIESPLAQPRNLVVGHFLSAVVAVAITKLFLLLPTYQQFDHLRWLAGALAVGAASVLMSFTKTVHPPAGATALLAATNVEIQELGWWLLPLVLLAAMLMLASALVLNNVAGRRFPIYWWTPVDLKMLRVERRREREREQAHEKGGDGGEVKKQQGVDDHLDPEKGVVVAPKSSSTSSSSSSSSTSLQNKESEVSDRNCGAGDGSGDDDLRRTETQATTAMTRRLSRVVSYSSASRVPHRLTFDSEEELDRQLSGQDGVVTRTRTRTRTTSSRSRSRRRQPPMGSEEQEQEQEGGGAVGGGRGGAGEGREGQQTSGRGSDENEEDGEGTEGVEGVEDEDESARIIITRSRIIVPDWLELNDYEDEILRILMERLRDG
ncbi:hypothetical protein ABEF95_017214 [Exophiala dermatitidis]